MYMNGLHLFTELYTVNHKALYFKNPRIYIYIYLQKRICFDVVHVHQILQTTINGIVKRKRLAHVVEKDFWVQFLALPL